MTKVLACRQIAVWLVILRQEAGLGLWEIEPSHVRDLFPYHSSTATLGVQDNKIDFQLHDLLTALADISKLAQNILIPAPNSKDLGPRETYGLHPSQ